MTLRPLFCKDHTNCTFSGMAMLPSSKETRDQIGKNSILSAVGNKAGPLAGGIADDRSILCAVHGNTSTSVHKPHRTFGGFWNRKDRTKKIESLVDSIVSLLR